MEQIDITLIGGGVIGLTTAYYLAQAHPHKSIVILEKNKRLSEEQSTHNSGVLHAGWAYTPNSLKAKLCVEGNNLIQQFATVHHIPHQETGKLVVATTQRELDILNFYHRRAIQNQVANIEFLSATKINSYEPNLTGIAALYIPSVGIIDAASYCKKLEQLVTQHNGIILPQHNVTNITPKEHSFLLTLQTPTATEQFETNILINTSGLNATSIGKMINPNFPYLISPTCGEYMKFNKTTRPDLNMSGLNVYPVPQPIKGMYDEHHQQKYALGNHLTPTFDMQPDGSISLGNIVLVGPLTTPYNPAIPPHFQQKKSPQDFIQTLHPYFPNIQEEDLQYDQIGIQAKLNGYNDFVIEQDHQHKNAFHILADSPGLTSSLAIAQYFIEHIFKG